MRRAPIECAANQALRYQWATQRCCRPIAGDRCGAYRGHPLRLDICVFFNANARDSADLWITCNVCCCFVDLLSTISSRKWWFTTVDLYIYYIYNRHGREKFVCANKSTVHSAYLTWSLFVLVNRLNRKQTLIICIPSELFISYMVEYREVNRNADGYKHKYQMCTIYYIFPYRICMSLSNIAQRTLWLITVVQYH